MNIQTTKQNSDLIINPLGDYNQIIGALQLSEYYQSADWFVQRLLNSPETIEAMQLAYKLGRNEVDHVLNFRLGQKPSEAIKEEVGFLSLSEENQSAVLEYASNCLKRAKYELYPEAYGVGAPSIPIFELPIPFLTDNDIDSIGISLNPYKEYEKSL